ncbi:MAG: hypothetical protein IT322_15510 [Anaerolineae bacterium]|nr:hypothetical protein [Anaerolineae bacterium]
MLKQRFLIVIILAALILPLGMAQAQSDVRFSPVERAIYYLGRVQRGETMLWTWAGTGFRVKYLNSMAVALHFSAENAPEPMSTDVPRLVQYRVNGGEWKSLLIPALSDQTFPLEITDSEGVLEVIKVSEGTLTFKGLRLASGGALAGAPLPRRKIEIIGDSITVGFRMNGMGGYETPSDHNARLTYGGTLAETFDAEVRLIAVTGAGLIHDYDTPPSESKPMPARYSLLHRAENSLSNLWAWQPDLILINLGSNDTTNPTVPEANFQSAMVRFLATIRAHNPSARIIVLQPFGLNGGSVPVYQAALKGAVQARRGDEKLLYLDTLGWLASEHFTDGAHPNAAGQSRAAEMLIPYLHEIMGWN